MFHLVTSFVFVASPMLWEHQAALDDARRLGPVIAARTRYLTMYTIAEGKRADMLNVLAFWVNSLSREADIVRPRQVTKSLVAVLLDDYGWDAATWDKLADEDPFFHVKIKFAAGTHGKRYFPAEGGSKAGWYDARFLETKVVSAIAPWIPADQAAELVALTQSAAPILRADWWFSRTSIQAGRNGTGYYDWFGLKKREDFEKLVGLNVKESQRVKREVAGIVARSGVANFPRQIFRFQSITGGYWVTRDALDDNQNERNALRQLDADYKHQAEEHYGYLPNGLFAFYLSDDKGVQQDTAPDKIGPDKTAPGNDGRIHVGLSCARCHVEGLRPIADWSRRVFQGPLKLSSPDPDKARRLRQIYLGELQEKIADDITSYTKVLKRTNGLSPLDNSKVIAWAWEAYVERDLTPADAAAELGVDEKTYLAKLRAAFAANPLADAVLASHIAEPPLPIRSDDWEQLFPLVAPTVLGVAK